MAGAHSVTRFHLLRRPDHLKSSSSVLRAISKQETIQLFQTFVFIPSAFTNPHSVIQNAVSPARQAAAFAPCPPSRRPAFRFRPLRPFRFRPWASSERGRTGRRTSGKRGCRRGRSGQWPGQRRFGLSNSVKKSGLMRLSPG